MKSESQRKCSFFFAPFHNVFSHLINSCGQTLLTHWFLLLIFQASAQFMLIPFLRTGLVGYKFKRKKKRLWSTRFYSAKQLENDLEEGIRLSPEIFPASRAHKLSISHLSWLSPSLPQSRKLGCTMWSFQLRVQSRAAWAEIRHVLAQQLVQLQHLVEKRKGIVCILLCV